MNNIDALLEKFGAKRGKIDLSLDRLLAFLEKIGSPQLKLPPVIHIAGTNGKGSTIAFLKAIIEAGGRPCHVYTSPHLLRFNERIVINGRQIDDDALYAILAELDREYEKHDIELTFFELTTLAAFMAFSRVKADYLLLETGMGGRYDATNIIAKPALTIITPISIDHTEFLGETLEKIAFEKAGIIKPGVTCIFAPQAAEAREVLEKTAREKQADLVFAAEIPDLPPLGLHGEYQKINASVAVAAAKYLGLKQINKGLANATWPARMQRFTRGPLADLLPPGAEIWLDGAHNIAGAKALAAEIAQINKPVYLIAGMLNSKDASGYFKLLKDRVEAIYTIPIPGEANSFSAEELKDIIGEKAHAASDAAAAIKAILAHCPAAPGIFICGSLYLAGHILKDNS